jgi:hypothetical protein
MQIDPSLASLLCDGSVTWFCFAQPMFAVLHDMLVTDLDQCRADKLSLTLVLSLEHWLMFMLGTLPVSLQLLMQFVPVLCFDSPFPIYPFPN